MASAQLRDCSDRLKPVKVSTKLNLSLLIIANSIFELIRADGKITFSHVSFCSCLLTTKYASQSLLSYHINTFAVCFFSLSVSLSFFGKGQFRRCKFEIQLFLFFDSHQYQQLESSFCERQTYFMHGCIYKHTCCI